MTSGQACAIGLVCTTVLIAFAGSAYAQSTIRATTSASEMERPVLHTAAADRVSTFSAHASAGSTSPFATVPATNIGPSIMSGRVVDIDVSPYDQTHFYVAYASGGLWRTTNNGQTFDPVFDKQASLTIGAIAVRWGDGVPDDIWVGTGESNSSRSSYSGTGVYRSRDGGETWLHLGLAESHHIGAVELHPDNSEIAWVAALGHLYSPNDERGLYRTEDGGRTWNHVLYVNDHAGAVAVELDPTDADVLYAATWERERRAWNFVESGKGSGLYKSLDSGLNWQLLSTPESGFPVGDGVGRIGLAIARQDPAILYALVDNQNSRPETADTSGVETLTRDELRAMDAATFVSLDRKLVEGYLKGNRFADKYDYDAVVKLVKAGTIEPTALVEYVEDANEQLYDTPVVGAELYRSADGGRSWNRTHSEYVDGLYNSYGYYFGSVEVSAFDSSRVYILGVPLLASDDDGATFSSVGGPSVHSDHQALWVSPFRRGHLIDGNDGGVNISYDDGTNWIKANNPPVGQFYAIQVDDAKPYNVYGGLQDNGVWWGPSDYTPSTRWHASGQYPYRNIAGGDGMQVEVDTRSNDLVYTGWQFGFYSRINTTTGEKISIRPRHELGERPLRFNWQTPIHLSRHQQDVLYLGANRLYRSLNQGVDMIAISDDLTKGGLPGDVPFGTLSSIDESPLRFGLLYTGSDDGLVHVSKDGGTSWTRISDALPQDRWISRVEASNHSESRVYVTLNGYRSDEFAAYAYVSEDYGQHWERIGTDLPSEPVNVILEDPDNEKILYVGTDHGLVVSVDRGASFVSLSDMPPAPVHDLKIQRREAELLVGTHGRSIFKIDIEHVRHVAEVADDQQLHVFAVDAETRRDGWGARRASWRDYDEPSVTVVVYSAAGGSGHFSLSDSTGHILFERAQTYSVGLNYLKYDLTVDPTRLRSKRKSSPYREWKPAANGKTYVKAGRYKVVASIGREKSDQNLIIRDPANP